MSDSSSVRPHSHRLVPGRARVACPPRSSARPPSRPRSSAPASRADARSARSTWAACCRPASGQAPARQAALGAGLPQSVPCVTVNKVCGSGLEGACSARSAIAAGDIDIGRRRRHGVDVERAAPAAQGARRAQDGPRAADRLDGPRRPVGRVQRTAHGQLRRAVRARRRASRARAQDEFAAESYRRALRRAEARACSRPRSSPVEIAAAQGRRSWSTTDEEPGRGDIEKLAGAARRRSRRTARSPPATPRRSTTAPRRWC